MAPITRRDLTLAALGAAGLATFVLFYRDASPHAAVDLTVTREEAAQRARGFVEALGADLSEHRRAVRFGGDTEPLVFLQRTLGLDEASRWAREEVPVWTWDVRWFEPGEKEEWGVGVGVDGRIVRFAHLVEEAAPGATLDPAAARPIAETFLREHGWRLDDLEAVEHSSEQLDNRTDHRFVWERRGTTVVWHADDPAAGTGAVRLSVSVQGDRVGSYRHYLRVPEQFSRDLSATLSVGSVLAIGSLGLTFIIVLIALGVAFVRHRRDDVRWREAITLGGAVAGLAVIAGAASWPVAKYQYPTEIPWSVFVLGLVVGLLFIAIIYAVWVMFTAGSGESLGRETFPESLRGWRETARGHVLSSTFARASLRGYALGFVILGYLTAFYVLAQRYFGAWLPAEGPSAEIFNTYLPFLAPLTVSLVAALTEELTYRLFGISFLKRYLRSTTLALLVPAAIWAFAHSNYPVFPVYVRGIELTIAGVLFGIGFLSLGLVACVVAHFVIDAILIGLPLLSSGNPAYVVSGIVVMGIAVVPVVVVLFGRVLGRRRGPPAAIT